MVLGHHEGRIHTTYSVDASDGPADSAPGIYSADPGYHDRWSLDF
ncbi:hypothetical protein ACWGJB_39510 [Streptomyces sp. NPDC054813]